jgi:uncharacterized sulfatase
MTAPNRSNLDRRGFLRSGGAALAAAWGAGAAGAARALAPAGDAAGETAARPNVLFLVIEDCSPIRFGCYGNKVCRTPNLDRLAASAVTFDAAHTVPPCGPSRTALLTGRRPTTTRVFGNFDRAIADEFFAAHPILPEIFKDAGYDAIKIGKFGHYDKNSAWTEIVRANDELGTPKPPLKPARGPAAKEGAKVIGNGFTYGPTGLDDADEVDGRMAELAIRRLKAPREKPFFLAVGFHSTHLAFRAPDKYFEMYPPSQMEVPKNPGSLPDGMPAPEQWEAIRRAEAFSAMGGNNPGTLEEWKEALAAHYACLTFVDAQIGRILDALEESGRAKDTVVVVWSDHGFVMGEHYTWRKGQMINESTRSALLIRAPGVTVPGARHAGPVECMDLHPTVLDLCGVPVPAGTEAFSLRPVLEHPERPWRKAALIEAERRHTSLVTDGWRYTEYGEGPEMRAELFDEKADPGEFVNLAADLAYAAKRGELKALLHGGWKAAGPAS